MIDLKMDILMAKDIREQLEATEQDIEQDYIGGAIYRLRRVTEWCTDLQNRIISDVAALETEIHLKESEK